MFEKLLTEILLEESVSTEEIVDAIKSHHCVRINYNSTKGQHKNTGERYIVPFALGTTTAGNPILRAFQPQGDSTSQVPSWKYFRLDRIENWRLTEETFTKEQIDNYSSYGEPNYEGDKTMANVYMVANFSDTPMDKTDQGGPVYAVGDKIPEKELMRRSVDFRKGVQKNNFTKKANQAYKNGELDDQEEILKQQRDEIDAAKPSTKSGPIMASDTTSNTNEPQTDEYDVPEVSDFDASEYDNTPFSKLAQQLANKPQKIDLSQFDKYEPTTNKKRW